MNGLLLSPGQTATAEPEHRWRGRSCRGTLRSFPVWTMARKRLSAFLGRGLCGLRFSFLRDECAEVCVWVAWRAHAESCKKPPPSPPQDPHHSLFPPTRQERAWLSPSQTPFGLVTVCCGSRANAAGGELRGNPHPHEPSPTSPPHASSAQCPLMVLVHFPLVLFLVSCRRRESLLRRVTCGSSPPRRRESLLRHVTCSYFSPFGICPFLLSTESSVTLMPSKVLIFL